MASQFCKKLFVSNICKKKIASNVYFIQVQQDSWNEQGGYDQRQPGGYGGNNQGFERDQGGYNRGSEDRSQKKEEAPGTMRGELREAKEGEILP